MSVCATIKKDDEALGEVARGMAEGTTLWLPCPISLDFKPQKTESFQRITLLTRPVLLAWERKRRVRDFVLFSALSWLVSRFGRMHDDRTALVGFDDTKQAFSNTLEEAWRMLVPRYVEFPRCEP